jgi:NH3-dependent NAD+ synthetase
MNEDTKKKFDDLVNWVAELIKTENAPGFLIGVSGTDSILAFLVCVRAFESLGIPGRVVGVHYGSPFPPSDRSPEEIAKILEISPSYRWFPRVVMPWLQTQAPAATLIVDGGIEVTSDHARWADLYRKAINDTSSTEAFDAENALWVVGTHNATEDVLGTYSNISKAVSLMPLVNLWKSEILEICQWLGVPTLAIEHSRQADCDCGRYDIAAAHIPEIDAILKHEGGFGVADLTESKAGLGDELWGRLVAFVAEQKSAGGFKKRIPYRPVVKTTERDRLSPYVKDRLRHLGSTFPVWRFPAARVNGTSLLEEWGMTRLERPNDLRDASLPDPARDEFGAAYTWHDEMGETYVELRRAYFLCTFYGESPVTVVIRNNSAWFGWDRLPERAYVSFAPMTVADLRALTLESFRPDGYFLSWVEVEGQLDSDDAKLRRVARAIDWLEVLRVDFHEWLTESREGLTALQRNLSHRLSAGQQMPNITRQHGETTYCSIPVDQVFLDELEAHIKADGNGRFGLPLFESYEGEVGEIWLSSGRQHLPLTS